MSQGFDNLRYIHGEAREIVGFYDKVSHLEMDAEDVMSFVVRMANGILVQLYSDFFQRPSRNQSHIAGENGSIDLVLAENKIKIYDEIKKKCVEIKYNFDIEQMYVDELKHYFECVRNHKTPIIDIRDQKKTLELALAAKQSCDKKKVMEL